jgi:hypothetical protein
MATPAMFSNGTSWEHIQKTLEGEETHGVSGSLQEDYAGSVITAWDAQIGVMLNEILLRWVRRLISERSAWPSFEEFAYEPEFVSTAAETHVNAVRARPYSSPEDFVVYTIDELRQFF